MVTSAEAYQFLSENLLWVVLTLVSLWFLRWYTFAEQETDLNPVEGAVFGVKSEIAINTQRAMLVGGFIIGSVVIAAKTLGFSALMLLHFDPTVWAAFLTAVAGILKLGGAQDIPTQSTLLGIAAFVIGMWLVQRWLRSRA